MDKTSLRKALLKQRGIAQRLEHEPPVSLPTAWLKSVLGPEHILGAYKPIRSERDPSALLTMLGHTALAFPKVPGPNQPLIFYAARKAEDFESGAFGVLEPLETLPIVKPHAVLVPMVGFDPAGYRIGYGGGFYDRTLSQLSSLNIGYAYDGQMSEQPLNFEATDMALDYIMTPLSLWDFTDGRSCRHPWEDIA